LEGCLAAVMLPLEALWSAVLRRPMRPRPLRVQLPARTATTVHVSIDTTGQHGAAAMKLVDRRGGEVVGGVTLLIVEGGLPDPPIQPLPAKNPCPMVLGEELYWLPSALPVWAERFEGAVPPGSEVKLVAWITNPTETTLENATVYLEHLGGADAEFQPATWNL